MTRFHKKRDGVLMIREDGTGRYLTMFERVKLWLGLSVE